MPGPMGETTPPRSGAAAIRFPTGFTWGAATASFQIEGVAISLKLSTRSNRAR